MFTGIKAQPWPAENWSDMYRFEKTDRVTGYIYNAENTASARWKDETTYFNNGAVSSILASSLALAAVALFSF